MNGPIDDYIENWLDLYEAIFYRARLDLLYGSKYEQLHAERFLLAEGFDPDKIRAAWQGRKLERRQSGLQITK